MEEHKQEEMEATPVKGEALQMEEVIMPEGQAAAEVVTEPVAAAVVV